MRPVPLDSPLALGRLNELLDVVIFNFNRIRLVCWRPRYGGINRLKRNEVEFSNVPNPEKATVNTTILLDGKRLFLLECTVVACREEQIWLHRVHTNRSNFVLSQLEPLRLRLVLPYIHMCHASIVIGHPYFIACWHDVDA